MHQHPQLTLPLTSHRQYTFDNFYVSVRTRQLIQNLQQLAKGCGESFIYLWGGSGVGRSHLLQATCEQSGEHGRHAVYLPLQEHHQWEPSMLLGMESMQLVCIDDINTVKGDPQWEEALFHLYNQVRDNKGTLLVAGDAAPTNIKLDLADLKSRLAWGLVYQIPQLDDHEKLAALQLRASDLGLELSDSVGQFLLNHCPRDMPALFAALVTLDQASLSAKRRLTIPFVKETLQF